MNADHAFAFTNTMILLHRSTSKALVIVGAVAPLTFENYKAKMQ